jgi:hypothetical protein
MFSTIFRLRNVAQNLAFSMSEAAYFPESWFLWRFLLHLCWTLIKSDSGTGTGSGTVIHIPVTVTAVPVPVPVPVTAPQH